MERENSFGLYTIRDVVADDVGPVFQAKNDAVAVRQYKRLLSEQQLVPSEYKLIRIGYFDTKNVELIPELNYVVMPYKDEEVKSL